jgi:DNA processing protein
MKIELEHVVALNKLRFNGVNQRAKKMLKYFSEHSIFEPDFTIQEIDEAKKEIEYAGKENLKIVSFNSEGFPQRLLEIKDRPLILYVKGEIDRKDLLSVSIVGSRKCTEYGRSVARSSAFELAKLGISIISGLAYGIDSEAHKGALAANGRTLAFLGSGIDVIYPPSNLALYEAISENGAVVSEFPLGTKPKTYNFPFRNRLISGFSLATIVVEAEEKSGSLITAAFAVEQGKDVFAVPGNISSKFSKGTNMLIKDGAIPFLSVDDILEQVKEFQELKKETALFPELSDEEEKILETMENNSCTLEEISEKVKMESPELLKILAMLEFKQVVKKEGGRFLRVK